MCSSDLMEPVQKEILDDVEKTLRTEFMSNLARTNKNDSHELMAEIFNHLDRSAEARFLDALTKRNAESSERICALMFTFQDLSKIGIAHVLNPVTSPSRMPSSA